MSSILRDLISQIDPTATPKSPVPSARQTQTASVPRPIPRPISTVNGAPNAPPLKRKASGEPNGALAKAQRKEGVSQPARPNITSRPVTPVDVAKTKPAPSTSTIPYRGTAAPGITSKQTVTVSKPVVKRPSPAAVVPPPVTKPANQPSKTVGTTPAPATTPVTAKKGSYAAMLQRAKQAQQAKPAEPPVKIEAPKILTKKQRLAMKAEASAAAKGKKPALAGPIGASRSREGSSDLKEKKKPAPVGYQGTARPVKKPVEIGYKGTARPQVSVSGSTARASSAPAAKQKPKPSEGRYSGYADWDDLDDMDDEEEDYESESDMEGGIWDVEEEEQLALKVAKKEDAEALAEETELKRQKEERKRKLLAMNKAAAAKRRY